MLKQRLITASILIPLFIWQILSFSSVFLAWVMSVVVIIGAWEWARLCGWCSALARISYVIFISISLFAIYWGLWWLPQSLIYILLIACLWWLVALRWVLGYQQGFDYLPTSPMIKAILGVLMLLPAWSALFILHDQYGGERVVFLLVLIWAADSGAYFIGRRWGKLKLADKVSPSKTWEGVAGAILFSSLVSLGYALIEAMPMSTLLLFMLLCLFTVLASILGDLLESLFKRQAGIKDSSQLLPGHGGVLDRIDSLTSAAPIFVTGIVLLRLALSPVGGSVL